MPLTKTPFLGAHRELRGDCLDVTWRFQGGTLRFVGNFGREAAEVEIGDGARLVWASPAADHRSSRLRLPSWTGAFLKTESQ